MEKIIKMKFFDDSLVQRVADFSDLKFASKAEAKEKINPFKNEIKKIYQDKDNSWKWFENSDFNNRGIHTKNNEQEIINYQLTKYKKFLKTFNITKEELEKIIIKVYEEPKYHITAEEYINHVINSKDYKGE